MNKPAHRPFHFFDCRKLQNPLSFCPCHEQEAAAADVEPDVAAVEKLLEPSISGLEEDRLKRPHLAGCLEVEKVLKNILKSNV